MRDGYRVKLQIFEGPLDLLLYLVKQNHLEITQIPIAQITDQYLRYLSLMQALDLEIAGEFLVMAATLMQIKSRMLLPPEAVPAEEAEEPDPTQELIQRLLEYQKYKEAADRLSLLERDRLVRLTRPAPEDGTPGGTEELIEASLFDLLNALSQFIAGEVPKELITELLQEEVTVEGKMALLRNLSRENERISLTSVFAQAKGKLEVVAIFLALLELIRLREVVVRQKEPFSEVVILKAPEVELTA